MSILGRTANAVRRKKAKGETQELSGEPIGGMLGSGINGLIATGQSLNSIDRTVGRYERGQITKDAGIDKGVNGSYQAMLNADRANNWELRRHWRTKVIGMVTRQASTKIRKFRTP